MTHNELSACERHEVARNVKKALRSEQRWAQTRWGTNDRGDEIVISTEEPQWDMDDTPTNGAPPDSPRDLCLAGAIIVHTRKVLRRRPERNDHEGTILEDMFRLYAETAGETPAPPPETTSHKWVCRRPWEMAIIEWNDRHDHDFEAVRTLTERVVRQTRETAEKPPVTTARPHAHATTRQST